jgi:hypothetical protein
MIPTFFRLSGSTIVTRSESLNLISRRLVRRLRQNRRDRNGGGEALRPSIGGLKARDSINSDQLGVFPAPSVHRPALTQGSPLLRFAAVIRHPDRG